MEDQVPMSQPPVAPSSSVDPSQAQQVPLPGYISPQQLEQMKNRARELAFQQTLAQQAAMEQSIPQQQPKVVYVRRNLTVAELALIFLLSCGLVTAFQAAWNFGANILPRIEIKMK